VLRVNFYSYVLLLIILLTIASNMGTLKSTAGNVFTICGSTYDTSNEEIAYWNTLTDEIANMARDAGYVVYELYGESTTKETILEKAQNTYIFIYTGHGKFSYDYYELHLFFVDNSGERVFDFEIYQNSNYYFYSLDYNERFVFLWSCFQAGGINYLENHIIGGIHDSSGRAYGMPYSWLYTTDLSTDGYADPYSEYGRVFIGFLRYAPIITYVGGSINEGLPGYNPPLYWFVKLFFFALLKQWKLLDPSGMSINEALNFASEIVWGTSFENTSLYCGYIIYDPENDAYYKGKMVVYGNGNYILINQRWNQNPPSPPPIPSSINNYAIPIVECYSSLTKLKIIMNWGVIISE